MNCTALTLASTLALSVAAASQSPVPLVLSGEALPGGGNVTGIVAVHVGYFGDWLVVTTTDSPAHPSVVLRPAGPWKQVGDAVVQPAGATIGTFDSFSSELFGGVTWVGRLDGTPGGSADDEAVFFENQMWIQEGPVQSWPGTNLPAGSEWLSFDDVRSSSAAGGVLFRGYVDDPTIPGPDETYMALGQLCGSVGVLCSVNRVITEGDLAPAIWEPITSVRLAPAAAAVSPSSVYVVWSGLVRVDPDSDSCVYRFHWTGGQHALLAREGKASPVAGRTWGPLDAPAVDVNSSGAWTLRATLDASDPTTDAVLVKSGTVVAQEGDTLPAVAPAAIAGFGRGPAIIDEAGRVIWFARLSGPGGSSQALFLDDQVLVRTGVTQIGGRTLVAIDGGVDAMSLGPQGDLLVFTGRLTGGIEGAFALDVSGL